MIKPLLPNTSRRSLHPKASCKTDEMLSANSSQHCRMLHVASVGTPCCMLLGVVSQTLKLDKLLAMCIQGHNNSQHRWANNVGSCCVHLHMSKSLTSFKLCATTPNNIATTLQQHATGSQWTQHVTFNNVGNCWPTMLHPFARGFWMKRPYRGVCMEGFDHILGDNFVIILIKGKVDKPIFLCSHQAN